MDEEKEVDINKGFKEFEKEVEYFETYFAGQQEEEQVTAKPSWVPIMKKEPEMTAEPYEGEIDMEDARSQFKEKSQPTDVVPSFGAGDLPDTIDEDVDMSKSDAMIFGTGKKGEKPDFDAGDLNKTIDTPVNMQRKDDIIYDRGNPSSNNDSSSRDVPDEYIMSELPALLARERLLVE